MTPLHPVARVLAGVLLSLAMWFAVKHNRPPLAETRIYYAPAVGATTTLPPATLVDTAAMMPLIQLAMARRLLTTPIATLGGRAVVHVRPNGRADSIHVYHVDHLDDIDDSVAAADLGDILARGLYAPDAPGLYRIHLRFRVGWPDQTLAGQPQCPPPPAIQTAMEWAWLELPSKVWAMTPRASGSWIVAGDTLSLPDRASGMTVSHDMIRSSHCEGALRSWIDGAGSRWLDSLNAAAAWPVPEGLAVETRRAFAGVARSQTLRVKLKHMRALVPGFAWEFATTDGETWRVICLPSQRCEARFTIGPIH